MAIVTLGIDIAKNMFALHGVDAAAKPILLKPQVPRAKLLERVATLPPCIIGLEACGGARHWAREFQRFGHTVRLIAPKFATCCLQLRGSPCRLNQAASRNSVGLDELLGCTSTNRGYPC